MSDNTQNAKGYLSSDAVVFNYDDPAPISTKLNILTEGNTCVIGFWQSGCGYRAWAPLPSRDKKAERRLGLAAEEDK